MSPPLVWKDRRPATAALGAGFGFWAFALVPFWGGCQGVEWLTVAFFAGLGAFFVEQGRPSERRFEFAPRAGEPGSVRVAGEDVRIHHAELVALDGPASASAQRFGLVVEGDDGRRHVVFGSEDPVRVARFARKFRDHFEPEFRWGSGNLLARRGAASRFERRVFVGSPWAERDRANRVIGFVLVLVAGLWIVLVSDAPSPVSGTTVFLAASVWLACASVAALGAFDRVVVELGDDLVVTRVRFGRVARSVRVPCHRLERLECIEHLRSAGFLYWESADGPDAVRLDPSTRRAIAESVARANALAAGAHS